jgi:hypothetical protein
MQNVDICLHQGLGFFDFLLAFSQQQNALAPGRQLQGVKT